MRFKSLFTLTFLFLFQGILFSQSFEEKGSGSWLEFSGSNKLDGRWSIPISGILRHHDLFETYDFSFIRTGLTYHWNPNTAVTGGIAYVNSKSYSDEAPTSITFQYWLYEEFSVKTKFRQSTLSHRWRLENRWIHTDGQTHVNHRSRYRIQFKTPVYGRTFVKSFNEIFLHLKGSIFNQNRFYVGIGREISPNLMVDIGYLKNHFDNSHHDAIRMGLTFTTDWTLRDLAKIEN